MLIHFRILQRSKLLLKEVESRASKYSLLCGMLGSPHSSAVSGKCGWHPWSKAQMARSNERHTLNRSTLAQIQKTDKQHRRHQEILNALQQSGSIAVEELSEKLQVSVVTIRRDLDELEQQGLLNRTHGGARTGHPLFYESFKNDRSFTEQVKRLADEKRRIGLAAAAMIQSGETIAVTPGTTTAEIIRALPLNCNITVVTNTVNLAMELSKRRDINVFVTGGHLRGDWFSLVGASAVQSLGNLLIHTLFIGADGIDAAWGASCHNAEESELNAALLARARRVVAVVDHTKFSLVAGWRICDSTAIDTLITDTGATDEMTAPFESKGVHIIRV
jgi:DeoR family transcriptional regulator of aga operon